MRYVTYNRTMEVRHMAREGLQFPPCKGKVAIASAAPRIIRHHSMTRSSRVLQAHTPCFPIYDPCLRHLLPNDPRPSSSPSGTPTHPPYFVSLPTSCFPSDQPFEEVKAVRITHNLPPLPRANLLTNQQPKIPRNPPNPHPNPALIF